MMQLRDRAAKMIPPMLNSSKQFAVRRTRKGFGEMRRAMTSPAKRKSSGAMRAPASYCCSLLLMLQELSAQTRGRPPRFLTGHRGSSERQEGCTAWTDGPDKIAAGHASCGETACKRSLDKPANAFRSFASMRNVGSKLVFFGCLAPAVARCARWRHHGHWFTAKRALGMLN